MARGGRRTAPPGQPKSNRTDMNQAVKVANDLPYGERARLQESQKVIALPNNAGVPPAAAPQPSAGGAPAPQAPPLDFARPTERPDEPVTAQPPMGAGADVVGAQLRALYQQAPNNDILRLIELHDRGF